MNEYNLKYNKSKNNKFILFNALYQNCCVNV